MTREQALGNLINIVWNEQQFKELSKVTTYIEQLEAELSEYESDVVAEFEVKDENIEIDDKDYTFKDVKKLRTKLSNSIDTDKSWKVIIKEIKEK